MQKHQDVVIIGAGAAGLLTGFQLASLGYAVLLIEQSDRVGRKLALCGGGNCNIGPRETDTLSLLDRYHLWPEPTKAKRGIWHSGKQLLYDFSPQVLKQLFTSKKFQFKGQTFYGLDCPIREVDGQLYPAHLDAPGLRQHLSALYSQAGGSLELGEAVIRIEKDQNQWQICQKNQTFISKQIVLAVGGSACPSSGAPQLPLAIVSPLGIPYRRARPAMGPLYCQNHDAASASGLVIAARIQIWQSQSRALLFTSEIDDLLITHKGFSGPLILDNCGLVHEWADLGIELTCDFLPSQTIEEQLADIYHFQKEHPKRQLASYWQGKIASSLVEVFCKRRALDSTMAISLCPKSELSALIQLCHRWPWQPLLPSPWNEAMSWTGGIEPRAINWQTMEVKNHPGLYCAGDCIALDRPCGGYSLYFAWATAMQVVQALHKN
jgi:predicted Rossmann fold flavoprotein